MHASSCQPYHHRPGGIADRLEALYDSGTWTDVDMVVESMKIFDSSLQSISGAARGTLQQRGII